MSKDGIEAMAEFGTVAVILPTTAYILRLKSPPVRQMIDQGVIVALGTDFNPNAFCLSMVRIIHFFCHLAEENESKQKLNPKSTLLAQFMSNELIKLVIKRTRAFWPIPVWSWSRSENLGNLVTKSNLLNFKQLEDAPNS